MATELYTTPLYNDANLVAYWRINEGSGGTSVSDSKGSNTGTASRTQILGSAGEFGNGGTFAAASSDKVTLTDINGHSAFTINIWAKISSTGGDRVPFASSDGFFEIICASPNISVGGQVWVDRNGTTGTNKNASVYVSATYDTNWHMYTLTANGTSYALYMDGVLLSSSFSLGTPSNSYVGTRIGCFHQSSGTPGDGEFWDGLVDDVSYFSRALSLAEIKSLHQSWYYPQISVNSFVLNGINIVLNLGRMMLTTVKSFTLTGIDLTLSKGKTLITAVGNFYLTGVNISFTERIIRRWKKISKSAGIIWNKIK